MSYLEAIALGVVQGLTEFLPVSSSGHLAVGHLVLGEPSPETVAFDVLVHGATLLVIFGVFGRLMLNLLRENRRLLLVILAASVPTALVGLYWREDMAALGRSPLALAGCFAVTGCFLWSSARAAREEDAPAEAAAWRVPLVEALLVGLAQALALAPGVSRSGVTISTGRLCGIGAERAVAFSFLLGTPAIVGALIAESGPIAGLAHSDPGPLAAGFAAAFASGLLAMGLLRHVARRGALPRFAPYCFLMAAACLVLAAVK
ncbi:MAG: undecaprenyl-diphosphate phosphatase [Planctomycetota bacterium]|nr:undecaprenyl-diphosphate phosphatase [Planctomycetota bacterium]